MKISKKALFHITLIFLVTRLLIVILGVYSYSLFPERGTSYQKKTIAEALDIREVWGRFDSDWYETLAREGYPQKPFSDQLQETWGFMPLYPLIMNLLSRILGCSLFISGLIISGTCTFLALLVLYKLFEEKYGKGIETVSLMMISAGSFYLNIVYTEGLFLLLTTLVFYLSHKGRLGWALIFAGLASVTRIQGCLLFVIPGIELIYHHRQHLYKYIPQMLLSLCPMLIFMIYLQLTCGEPFAFVKIQHAWGSAQLVPLQGFLALIRGILPGASFVNALFWVMILGVVISCYRKLPLSYLIFTGLYFLLSTSNESLYGATRYMLGILPVFAAVSIGSVYVKQLFIVINLLFLTLTIAAFVTDATTFI